MTEKQKEFLDMIVYQIYPRSFKDSNGDGIGDLNGITEKLDYLKELGVNAIWISPCYKSPNEDNGYDISNYCDIMDEFGTLEDWKKMIDEMHKRGIKLIMDFVANHTSSEHRWFKESRKSKDNPYSDYYYWADEPLNDWQACFGGSVWQYDEGRKQYYLHSFAVGQPDLNWENPKVREEMKNVVDFWVNLGVDGFRCDVLDQISKDFEKGLTSNGPRLHEYINMLFGRKETEHIFTVGECWGANEENIKLLTDADRKELSTVFQFEHISQGYVDGSRFAPEPINPDKLRDCLIKWQNIMQKNDLLATLFFENHDQPRVVSKFTGKTEKRYEAATMFATMTFLQKGIPFIYQGQEIGMPDPYTENVADFDDIETVNYYKRNIGKVDEKILISNMNYGSRDNGRRPMAWNDGENGGFGGKPWLPIHDKYKEINVEKDINSEHSVYRFFKELIKLRKCSDAFKTGVYEDLTGERSGIYIYKRTGIEESFIVVCNFGNETEIDLNIEGNCVLSNYGKRNLNGRYLPYECAVFKV